MALAMNVGQKQQQQRQQNKNTKDLYLDIYK